MSAEGTTRARFSVESTARALTMSAMRVAGAALDAKWRRAIARAAERHSIVRRILCKEFRESVVPKRRRARETKVHEAFKID
jgi:hypothetical protein